MTYNIVDLRTNKIVGSYETAEAAERAESHLVHEPQDLKAACDWLAKNDISGVAFDNNSLDKLANIMPSVDPELVQRRLYGSKL